MPFLIFPPFPPSFSPYWNGILSQTLIPVSIFFLLTQTMCSLIFNLVCFPAYFSPTPWCKPSIGVLHCVSGLLLRKRSNGFSAKHNTYVTRFHTFLLQWSLSFFFFFHWLRPSIAPLVEAQIPWISTLNLSSVVFFFLSSSQFLSPGLHPSLLHPTSSSSSLARGLSLLFCCSSPACAVRGEEWGSM